MLRALARPPTAHFGGALSLVLWAGMGAAWQISGGAAGAPAALSALDAAGLLALAAVIVLGTCAAFGLFLHGVSLAGGVTASMVGAAEPVSATILSAVWLGTVSSPADWAGLLLMVCTIVLMALPKPQRSGGKEQQGACTPAVLH